MELQKIWCTVKGTHQIGFSNWPTHTQHTASIQWTVCRFARCKAIFIFWIFVISFRNMFIISCECKWASTMILCNVSMGQSVYVVHLKCEWVLLHSCAEEAPSDIARPEPGAVYLSAARSTTRYAELCRAFLRSCTTEDAIDRDDNCRYLMWRQRLQRCRTCLYAHEVGYGPKRGEPSSETSSFWLYWVSC